MQRYKKSPYEMNFHTINVSLHRIKQRNKAHPTKQRDLIDK